MEGGTTPSGYKTKTLNFGFAFFKLPMDIDKESDAKNKRNYQRGKNRGSRV